MHTLNWAHLNQRNSQNLRKKNGKDITFIFISSLQPALIFMSLWSQLHSSSAPWRWRLSKCEVRATVCAHGGRWSQVLLSSQLNCFTWMHSHRRTQFDQLSQRCSLIFSRTDPEDSTSTVAFFTSPHLSKAMLLLFKLGLLPAFISSFFFIKWGHFNRQTNSGKI